MADDVLNQDDIDALLNAVSNGELEEEAPRQMFSQTLHENEKIEIKDYDFKRPERISKEQMRTLQTLHETFARNFGAAASGFLRAIVEVRVAQASQMSYAEFAASLPNPTSFSLVKGPPLSGAFCLEMSPLAVYPIIDRLLGGSGKELFVPQRPVTLIEQRLIQKILNRAMQVMSEAWSTVMPIEFELGEMESNPQLMQIVPPNEVVVVIQFEVKLGKRAGTMSFCIPYNTIEPIMDRLSAQTWAVPGHKEDSEKFGQRLVRELGGARMALEATLAETSMTVADLLSLEVGDLILTGKSAAEPVVLSVGGRPKFFATIGQNRGSRALRIARAVTAADRF
ncbi:MAG: flagellar motor switch protein FliM [Phycisphaerae bacterium]|nr:flagellar motor switch protein FliM [Phycisphaerae bacterium]